MEIRKVFSVLAFIGSLFMLVMVGFYISYTLEILPSGHLEAYGQNISAFTAAISKSAPAFHLLLNALAILSFVVVIFLWRSSQPTEVKSFFTVFLAAINMFMALFFAITFMLAYFIHPIAANLA